jgi:glycosyltransferase involved in cell wall biosynthesis
MDNAQSRVLHVIKRLDIVGGAERIVAELVRKLPHHDVLVYGGGDSFFDLGTREVMRAKNILHALWLCVALRGEYSTFHLHLFPSIYFAFILGKKSIIHEHNTHNARRNHAIFRPIEWLIYRRARKVLAISEATKTALQCWVGQGPNIHTLLNFVPPIFKVPAQVDMPRPCDQKHLVMVASFTMQKRQELLIRSMCALPEGVHVSFAGIGPKLDACKSLVEELGLSHRVNFLGAVSDVAALYADADLCVLLSHWEGFGLVVIEAAQCGVPSLVSDVEGLRDVCPDPCLLFKGGDAIALAKQIDQILSREITKVNSQELLDFASKFGIEGYINKLESIYAG